MSETSLTRADERAIWMYGDVCSTCLWDSAGYAIDPEELPISPELRRQLGAWADWYDSVEAPERPGDPWQAVPGTPVAEFTAEGRRLARALTAELPPGWTIVAEDVDAWRFRGEREQRQITLRS